MCNINAIFIVLIIVRIKAFVTSFRPILNEFTTLKQVNNFILVFKEGNNYIFITRFSCRPIQFRYRKYDSQIVNEREVVESGCGQ